MWADLEEGVGREVLRDLARVPRVHARRMPPVEQLAQEADARRAGAAEDEDQGRRHNVIVQGVTRSDAGCCQCVCLLPIGWMLGDDGKSGEGLH